MGTEHPHEHAAARRAAMAAVRDLDGATVREVLLRSLHRSGVDDTVAEVVIPVLREVGDGWASGELGVLHEHFASSAVRGVLGDLRMPVRGEHVHTAVLACPPNELHDLPLELFGAMLHARGWRVVGLGANTPMTAVGQAVRVLAADACVLAGVRRSAFESRLPSLARLGQRVPLFLAGEGAHGLPSTPPGATLLPRDLREAAATVEAVATAVSSRPHADRSEPAAG